MSGRAKPAAVDSGTIKVTVTIPPELVARVDAFASTDLRSRSGAVVLLLTRGLEAVEKPAA